MLLQEEEHWLKWQLTPALVPSYSGDAEEEGKLQGRFSISLTQQLCRKPMEATQVTSYRVPAQPRGCSRNRQLESSHQGSLSPLSLSQTCVGVLMPAKDALSDGPRSQHSTVDGELEQIPLTQTTCSIPMLLGHFEGQRQSLLSLTYYINGLCDGDRRELCQLIAVVMRERNNPFSSWGR